MIYCWWKKSNSLSHYVHLCTGFYMPWAPKTMKNKGFGQLKTRLFTINTSKNVGLGGPWCFIHPRWFSRRKPSVQSHPQETKFFGTGPEPRDEPFRPGVSWTQWRTTLYLPYTIRSNQARAWESSITSTRPGGGSNPRVEMAGKRWAIPPKSTVI